MVHKMKRKTVSAVFGTVFAAAWLGACGLAETPSVYPQVAGSTASQSAAEMQTASKAAEPVSYDEFAYDEKSSYMIYYGVLDDRIIEEAKQYEVVILHPKMGNITRDQVQRIRESGTIVLGYIAIGEDLRTAGMTPEQMLQDPRFTGDGTGPRVDPRPAGAWRLDDVDIMGKASEGGTGYASYFLDDNDHNGKPDINPIFNCAFTNIGDPAWFEALDQMTIDGQDQIPGIREILTDTYGRGLGCDGLFLDTIDTCAPNSYTDDSSPNKTKFEWTAPGVADFTKHLKEAYPDKLVLQNRGIFFYNSLLPHYKYNPRPYVDYVLYESYMLDSNSTTLYYEGYYADNRYNYMPKLMAEAGRPDGFEVLSLGYAEGPEEFHLKDTLTGASSDGLGILLEDLNTAQEEAGFKHYITDGGVTLVNDFVIHHENKDDTTPPAWSSVYNPSQSWPPHAPAPRVGIQKAEPISGGMIVRWDVALDRNHVSYVLYYQTEPFDFEKDPHLKNAESFILVPEVGDGYTEGVGPDIYPYQAVVEGLDAGKTYYFVIRARDDSKNQNEDKNTVVLRGVPLK